MGSMNLSVPVVLLAGLCVSSAGLGGDWVCNGLSWSLKPDDHKYWGNLAPLPPGGVDRVIWDGGFTESHSTSLGPGGRWIGRHGPSESVEPSTYRKVVQGDDDGCLELKQTRFLSEAWVHGFEFGEALGVDSLPVSMTDFITLRFRARTFTYPECDPFEVRLFVHDRSVEGFSEELFSSGSWYIPETEPGEWLECRLTLPVDPIGGVLDAANWAPRVSFRMDGDLQDDGVLLVDDLEVSISSCDEGIVGLVPPPDAEHMCEELGGQHQWWLYMCHGDYVGGGEDGTSPLEMPTSCPVDVDRDCEVSVGDILVVISGWGGCYEGEPCPGDVDGDGAVGIGDLLLVIGAWGETCD